MHSYSRGLLVIGLDAADPRWIFNQWRGKLPAFSYIMEKGCYGALESTVPPTTIPAWLSLVTGRDPGELGVYGRRNRRDYGYADFAATPFDSLRIKTIWDYLDLYHKRSLVVGVPATFPPRKVNGIVISGNQTPSAEAACTYPPGFKQEIAHRIEENFFDVPDFRSQGPERLHLLVKQMTRKRLRLVHDILKRFRFDFTMAVLLGTDRIHHGYWRYMDKGHPEYTPDSPFGHVIMDYYTWLDKQVGKCIDRYFADHDIMVVSDHGVRTCLGCFAVNQWLEEKGYLRRKQTGGSAFDSRDIDWSQTRAWATGGFCGRIYFNLQGREPQGIVPASQRQALQEELRRELENVTDLQGQPLGNRCFLPKRVFRKTNGIAPDLLLYAANLAYRCSADFSEHWFSAPEELAANDGASHSQDGIFMLLQKEPRALGDMGKWSIYDITPTIMDHFMMPKGRLKGRSILSFPESTRVVFR